MRGRTLEPGGVVEKAVHRGQGPGGDHPGGLVQGDRVEARGMDGHRAAHEAGGLAKKGTFTAVRLDEVNVGHTTGRENEPRDPRAAPHVNHGTGAVGQQREKLGRVQKVTTPRVR